MNTPLLHHEDTFGTSPEHSTRGILPTAITRSALQGCYTVKIRFGLVGGQQFEVSAKIRLASWARTTMSDRYLPPKSSDYIVDLLRDQPETLKRCCLASKSWVPRTRKYLFGEIALQRSDDVEAWKRT